MVREAAMAREELVPVQVASPIRTERPRLPKLVAVVAAK
jgi:hypothetical protein